MSTSSGPRIASLHVYPLKSAGGIELARTTVDQTGLAHDRQWLVVDLAGSFLTQRSHPRMALLRTSLEGGVLRVGAPGMSPLELPVAHETVAPGEKIAVWGLDRFARSCGAEAGNWMSDFLHLRCRVVRSFTPHGEAGLDERGRVRVGFADGYPALAISAASLADLNARLPEPLPMNRFRPNLVVEGVLAYGEDTWQRVRIGPREREVSVLGRKRCDRCVITTTNQDSAERGIEPLRALARYRRTPGGEVAFGMNLGFEGAGILRAGDPVYVDEATS